MIFSLTTILITLLVSTMSVTDDSFQFPSKVVSEIDIYDNPTFEINSVPDEFGNTRNLNKKAKSQEVSLDSFGNLDRSTKNALGGIIDCACDSIYSVGDTVMLLIDNPGGNPGLFIGDTGTVLCGGVGNTGVEWIKVEWDKFNQGHNQENCGCLAVDPTEELNRWHVSCDMVEPWQPPTGACCIETECDILSEKECLAVGGVYNGDETNCETTSCDGTVLCACDSIYSVGDTVMLLIDNPGGNPGLFIGDTGTVLCGGVGNTGVEWIKVEWDKFNQGHNQENCGCLAVDPTEELNRWHVSCDMVMMDGTSPCPSDINQDGNVDINDLLILIGSWGACP